MANIEKMEKEFNALMKKYESASMIREWNNASHSVNLTENLRIREQEIKGFKKRFEAAKNEEEVTPEV
ncbi:hypothetical protein C2I27_03605 [Priestia megaterium]|uniref:hypothetical protein n=1 Tax=Priestia megaterium TaxID=1404 RepID=UPI000D523E8E|nr:hypothetical protein [Priestia megaterium]PVC74985.1 hypothetical protein C2I27_03605 [Priestia megaterium]